MAKSGRAPATSPAAPISPPTDTSVGMLENIEKDLNAAKADYKTLMDRDVPAFNRAIGGAITPLTGGR